MSCSSKSYLDRASRSSTHPAGSCSSTGKSLAPRNRRAEEDDPMRLRTAVIGMIALAALAGCGGFTARSEEHTSELPSLAYLVCRLLLLKKKNKNKSIHV